MSDIIRPLEVIETEINFYKQQTATGIIEIGKRLIEAKAQLPHGEWGKWLKEKVEFSNDTAKNFMKIATEFSNSEPVRNLSYTKLFLLTTIPSSEREEFITDNKIEEMTKRELQQAIKAKKEAEQKVLDIEKEINELKNRPEPEPIIKEVEKIVVPADYEAVKGKFATLTQQLKDKESKIKQLHDEKTALENKTRKTQQEVKEFNDLKKKIEFMQREKSDIARQIESATEFAGLIVELDNILKNKLAPIKYSRIMERMDSPVAVKNLFDIVTMVEKWCVEMRKLLPNGKVIDIEVIK